MDINKHSITLKKKKKYTLLDATLLSIGGMIGGGIFILNGLITQKNKKWAPLSWFLGLIIALLISFSYIILSQEYNYSNGGTIYYFEKIISYKSLKKIYSLIVIFGYICLATVYSQALGEYTANYINKPKLSPLIAIATIIFCMIVNYCNEKKFIQIENYSVLAKIVIFIILILIGLIIPKSETVSDTSISSKETLSYMSIIIFGLGAFLTYEGFEMISNVTPKLENKKRNIPLSYIISIVITGLIYMGTSYVSYKHLGKNLNKKSRFFSILTLSKKYPLGRFGPIIVIALALLANITAINSTLFVNDRIINRFIDYMPSSSKLKRNLSHKVKIPFFSETRKSIIWITCALSALLVFCPLVVTTNLGSVLFLIIFGVIGFLGYKLFLKKESRKESIFIFNTRIPYYLGKMITICSVCVSFIGVIVIFIQIRNYISGNISI